MLPANKRQNPIQMKTNNSLSTCLSVLCPCCEKGVRSAPMHARASSPSSVHFQATNYISAKNKIMSELNVYELFLLLFAKQYSIATVYLALTLHWGLSVTRGA